MTYQEIRAIINSQSLSNQKMETISCGRFTVMMSDKIGAVLVDSDVAEITMGRRWCMDLHGYPVANINGNTVRLHELVMAMDHECLPDGYYVDHINQDKLDNRRINLRFVTPQESSRNMPLKANNTSGYTGVSKTKYGTYRAYITFDKIRRDLGQYKTIEEAAAARREAENRLGFKTRPGTIQEAIHS